MLQIELFYSSSLSKATAIRSLLYSMVVNAKAVTMSLLLLPRLMPHPGESVP